MSSILFRVRSILVGLCLFAGLVARADGLIVIHDSPHRIPGHPAFAPLSIKYHLSLIHI